MKKTFYFLLFTVLFFSCQKDKSSSSQAQKTPSVVNVVKADSLLKNDTGSFERPKTINDITCAQSNAVAVKSTFPPYVIIARFPASTAVPNVLIPQQSWTIGSYTLDNQGDGNMVLYKGIPSASTAIWKSDTYGTNRKFYLQTDLNMVAYVNGTPIWDAKTQSYRCTNHVNPENLPQNMALILVNNGDLEIVADGVNGNGVLYTVLLGSTRTTGGVVSPNNGKFFLDYTTGTSQTGVAFKY